MDMTEREHLYCTQPPPRGGDQAVMPTPRGRRQTLLAICTRLASSHPCRQGVGLASSTAMSNRIFPSRSSRTDWTGQLRPLRRRQPISACQDGHDGSAASPPVIRVGIPQTFGDDRRAQANEYSTHGPAGRGQSDGRSSGFGRRGRSRSRPRSARQPCGGKALQRLAPAGLSLRRRGTSRTRGLSGPILPLCQAKGRSLHGACPSAAWQAHRGRPDLVHPHVR
jgi:hypothetical protein